MVGNSQSEDTLKWSMRVDLPLPGAWHELILHTLERALSDLSRAPGDDFDGHIHGARKKLKRARGLLRLVRDAARLRQFESRAVQQTPHPARREVVGAPRERVWMRFVIINLSI